MADGEVAPEAGVKSERTAGLPESVGLRAVLKEDEQLYGRGRTGKRTAVSAAHLSTARQN